MQSNVMRDLERSGKPMSTRGDTLRKFVTGIVLLILAILCAWIIFFGEGQSCRTEPPFVIQPPNCTQVAHIEPAANGTGIRT